MQDTIILIKGLTNNIEFNEKKIEEEIEIIKENKARYDESAQNNKIDALCEIVYYQKIIIKDLKIIINSKPNFNNDILLKLYEEVLQIINKKIEENSEPLFSEP